MNKEYVMEDIFHKVELKRIKKSFDKAKDVSKEPTSEFNLPLINAKNGDNGIMYYGRMSDWESDTFCIDIINDGAVSTGNVYAQPQRTGVLYNAYMIKPHKTIESEEILLFLAKTIEKAIKHRFGYDNKATWEKVKLMPISLPVIESHDPSHEYTVDDIDWQYMRDHIAELERDRIAELDAYLQATGLNDYELTEKDKKILSDNTVVFSEKLIEDLFVKVEAKCKKLDFDKRKDTSTEPNDEFCVPLINAKLGDNGIMFYGRPDDWNAQSMCIDVVQNGAVATGKVYAQPQSTAVLWDAYLIKPIKENATEEVLLYFARCIEKLTKESFSYEKKATWERIKECNITIPITSDGEPDFDYMERYIRAMEKVVIADVVKYKNQVIETTKKVVGE